MNGEDRERLRVAVDARRRALCGIRPPGAPWQRCSAHFQSGRPCRYYTVAGFDYCRMHLHLAAPA